MIAQELVGATYEALTNAKSRLHDGGPGTLPETFEFTLSNDAIAAFDKAHPAPGREPTPLIITARSEASIAGPCLITPPLRPSACR